MTLQVGVYSMQADEGFVSVKISVSVAQVLGNFLENFRKLVGGSVYGEVRYADFVAWLKVVAVKCQRWSFDDIEGHFLPPILPYLVARSDDSAIITTLLHLTTFYLPSFKSVVTDLKSCNICLIVSFRYISSLSVFESLAPRKGITRDSQQVGVTS